MSLLNTYATLLSFTFDLQLYSRSDLQQGFVQLQIWTDVKTILLILDTIF